MRGFSQPSESSFVELVPPDATATPRGGEVLLGPPEASSNSPITRALQDEPLGRGLRETFRRDLPITWPSNRIRV